MVLRPPALVYLLALLLCSCSEVTPVRSPPPVITPELATRSAVPSPDAEACLRCHPAEVAAWRSSQHALANRLVSPELDGARFSPERVLAHGRYTIRMRRDGSRFQFVESSPAAAAEARNAEAVIGVTPLVQYLVPFPGGRLQTIDAGFDPRSNEWFYVFSDARQTHEWGYWTNRSMNWNSQCAFCHMTGFRKNYDPRTDTYASTWEAMGISCGQCHALRASMPGGPPAGEIAGTACPLVVPSNLASRVAYIAGCASCHARREELTGQFAPGERFEDHFRLALPDTALFHPDGQVNDENFEYASLMLSRMGHRGVDCLDCHDPHSGRLKLPVEGNAICLQCHAPPGQRGAIVIDPLGHSGHSPTNRGSLCVECHMPKNTYMVRDQRRDHGMTSPDPLLTRELGLPNACQACHADQPLDWSIQTMERWYATNLERRARARARVIAAARRDDPAVLTNLLALTASEEIDVWRAALLELVAHQADRPEAQQILQKALHDTYPLARAAAIHGLQAMPGGTGGILPLLRDPVRLVRIDAARATAGGPHLDATSYGDLIRYLDTSCDQPAGALRQAQLHLAEGRVPSAELWARKAVAWDPSSAATHSFLGQLLHHAGKAGEAEAELRAASALATNEAVHPYLLALLLAEQAGRLGEVTDLLQQAVALDPAFGRAWYNLGLAYAAGEKLTEAVAALSRAEAAMPDTPEAAYAAATVHLRKNEPAAAAEACRRALAIEPRHTPSRELLDSLAGKAGAAAP